MLGSRRAERGEGDGEREGRGRILAVVFVHFFDKEYDIVCEADGKNVILFHQVCGQLVEHRLSRRERSSLQNFVR